MLCGMRLDHPMIIQTILLDPSRAVWTDEAPNVSRLDPSRAVQADTGHPARNRKVVGSNPTSISKTVAQRPFLALPTARRQQAVIPLVGSSRRRRPLQGLLELAVAGTNSQTAVLALAPSGQVSDACGRSSCRRRVRWPDGVGRLDCERQQRPDGDGEQHDRHPGLWPSRRGPRRPGQGVVEQLDDGGRHASDARRSALRVSSSRGSLRARRSR